MKKTFNNMGEFSIDVFHDATAVEHLIKLKHEADEAIENPQDIFEYADCILAIYAAAYKSGFTYEDISKACEEKFEILKTRNWAKGIDNIYQHI